jgi:ribosomal protein S12 methylthiotransferase accessory factor
MTIPYDAHPGRRYKTVEPEETIHRIRNILFQNDIFLIESQWFRERDYSVSLGLSAVDLPIRTAGKGIDERYALASAYAEFMERLQNLLLINGNLLAGRQPVGDILFSDAQRFDYEMLKERHADVLRHLFMIDDIAQLDGIFSRCKLPLHSYPYYNMTKASIEYLPHELLSLSIGSNGMCAGNTIEEALIQGLCEIFERYVFRTIYDSQWISFPVVPDDYMIKLPQWKYVEILRSRGFEVFVKDCSLHGILPVAGVLIAKDGRAVFNLGASPDFSIAVERCFTEMFQGSDLQLIENKLRPIAPLDFDNADRYFAGEKRRSQYQYYLSLRAGMGIVHPSVFDHSQPFNSESLSRSDSLISKNCLRTLLKIARRLGRDLYIRDVSFLGFPAFQVYIPGISEIIRLEHTDLAWRLLDLPRARKVFFSLDKSSPEEIFLLIKTIENLLDYPYIEKDLLFQKLHNLNLRGNVILNNVDLENILALLYFKSGDARSAHRVLENYIRRILTTEQFYNPPQFAQDHFCLLQFFEFSAERRSLDDAKDMLKNKYPEEIVAEIYNALKDLSRLPHYFGIPACIDCDACEYRPLCSIDHLRDLAERIQKRIDIRNFDHVRVREYLEDLMES